jgi:amidase
MSEITSYSLSEIAALIASREVSPVEVMAAHLRRIEERNSLNAVVTLAQDAMDKAKAAEQKVVTGDGLGPLHGVPVTIKDTIETKGILSTSGSARRKDFIPSADAPAVARLKAAGAIVLGKTNAAEMAMDYNADNPVFGRTNHPGDDTRTPGGSSGGEAVAIAAGMSPGGLGTDLAGSIRIPAHFCGIAGLKPTVGVVPGEGQFPPSHGPYGLGSVIGPMARRVEDLELLLNALTADSRAPKATVELKGQCFAWYTDDRTSPVTDETRTAVTSGAEILNAAGLVGEEILPPGIEKGNDLWLKLFSRASVVQLRNVYAGREDLGGDFVRWRLSTADDKPVQTIDEYIEAWLERDRLRAQLLKWMEQIPLLLAPVGATPAFSHGSLKLKVGEQSIGTFRAFSYCQAFNVFDLPVVVVPVGCSPEGLPIGVQIVGRPFAEKTVLAAAAVIQSALDDPRTHTKLRVG